MVGQIKLLLDNGVGLGQCDIALQRVVNWGTLGCKYILVTGPLSRVHIH